MARRQAALVAALSLILNGGTSSSAAAATSATILGSYRSALLARKPPANMEFEYTVTRSGPNRIRTEQHRVYWTATGEERNDTISVNGTPLIPAASRMLHRSAWPYDVGQFAASADEYDATAAGLAVVAGRKTYAFTLTRNAPADFVLKTLYVDAKTRLPVRQTFSVIGPDCQASGLIEFGATSSYWLPNFVSVVCTGAAAGASPAPIFKESIRFSSYTFPAAIPPDVFGTVSPPQSTGATTPANP